MHQSGGGGGVKTISIQWDSPIQFTFLSLMKEIITL